MKTLTLKQAKNLKHGDVLYHLINTNSDGTPQRWRVNGKPKIWKKDESKVKVPVKHGLRNCDYLDENCLNIVTLIPFEKYFVKTFLFLSEGEKFQRKMQREKYHTRLEKIYGTHPMCKIHYWI
jgi:hypothetical protein